MSFALFESDNKVLNFNDFLSKAKVYRSRMCMKKQFYLFFNCLMLGVGKSSYRFLGLNRKIFFSNVK